MAIHFFPRCFSGASQTILVKEVPPNSCGANSRGTFGGPTGEQKQRKDGRLEHPKDQLALVSFCLSKQSIQICSTFQNPFFHSLISLGDVFE